MQAGLRKEDSLVIKGVAIFLMMWHHCFLSGRFEKYDISFIPFTAQQVSSFASFSKICVSLFAFVSGYGLLLSWHREKEHISASRWVVKRYLKSFIPMWFVIILCWIVTFLLSRRPITVYFKDGIATGILYMAFDYLGVANLFGTPNLVGTWWYLTASISFILLTPLFANALEKFGAVPCFVLLMLIPRCVNGFPGGTHFLSFLPPFVIGMVFAQTNYLSVIEQKLNSKTKLFVGALLSVLLSALLCHISTILPRKSFWDITLGLFTSVYVVTIYLTLCRIPGISQIFRFLGKHSANVFLIHGFLRSTYLSKFIYSRGHFVLIILTLLICSLIVSFLIELLKMLIRFESFQQRVLSLATAA